MKKHNHEVLSENGKFEEFAEKINWKMFYQQKLALLELTEHIESKSAKYWIEGLLGLLDELGDVAESEGFLEYPEQDEKGHFYDSRYNDILKQARSSLEDDKPGKTKCTGVDFGSVDAEIAYRRKEADEYEDQGCYNAGWCNGFEAGAKFVKKEILNQFPAVEY